ncbi:hypothetical protein VTO42DRAFT_8805 [Malbranchea cinnamomea]
MPLSFRASPCPSAPSVLVRLRPTLHVHAFSSSAGLFAEAREPTYYEILNVPITATTQEIKKQFYALSLTHHPDRNPDDPEAHTKFASISSAYQVLSNATKRARYDRDHGIHRQVAAAGPTSTRSNVYRGSYVGSRPPSGLSKRRGEFRGPPPSFYAHGGYGNTSHWHGRHSHPHQQHTHDYPHQSSSSTSSSSPFSNTTSGRRSSPTDDPTSFIFHNPIPHFDAGAHFRTQAAEDARRRIRRAKAFEQAKQQARARGIDVDEDVGSAASRFCGVMGLVVVAILCINIGKSIEPMPSTMRRPSTAAARIGDTSQGQHKAE